VKYGVPIVVHRQRHLQYTDVILAQHARESEMSDAKLLIRRDVHCGSLRGRTDANGVAFGVNKFRGPTDSSIRIRIIVCGCRSCATSSRKAAYLAIDATDGRWWGADDRDVTVCQVRTMPSRARLTRAANVRSSGLGCESAM